MDSKTKTFLGCGAVLILITISLVGYFAYWIYSFANEIGTSNKEIPNEIKEARILKGSDFLNKTEIVKLTKESIFETGKRGATATNEKEKQKIIQHNIAKGVYGFSDLKILNNQIIAVGQFGGFVFDLQCNLQREILFEPSNESMKVFGFEVDNYRLNLDSIEIVLLTKDKFGFISNDSISGATVYDENGNQIWNYGKEQIELNKIFDDINKKEESVESRHYILEATAGDLDADGISEYVVSQNNEGIFAFDQNGKEKWFQSDEFANNKLKIIDVDGDRKNELIEIGSKVRNGIDGKVLREMKGDDNKAVLFVDKIDGKKVLQFCSFESNKIICKDEDEKTFFETDAPLSKIKIAEKETVKIPIQEKQGENDNRPAIMPTEFTSDTESVYKPKAVWVSLKKDKPKYLAVIAGFIGIPRSNFYVYDEKGTLVYHELLPEDAETITTLPNSLGNEEILVGGKDTIWKVAIK